MRRLVAVLALIGAMVVPSAASAQGRFLDAGKTVAGVVIVGGIACALTRAFLSSSVVLCSPNQLRQAGYPPLAGPVQVMVPAGIPGTVSPGFNVQGARIIELPPAPIYHRGGARHLSDGRCALSDGRIGVDKNGACFVPD